MSEVTPEALAAIDPGHVSLFGEKPAPTKHLVREHERILPPKTPPPEDPDLLTLDLELPPPLPPQPRRVVVKPHVRRNPRRKETTMTDCPDEPYGEDEALGQHLDQADGISTMPENRTDVTAMKDEMAVAAQPALGGQAYARNSDPATSHGAAQVATHSLRRRMAEVLRAFQAQDATERLIEADRRGMTDDELVDRLARLDVKGSPSGFRTARKDLDRLGLLEPLSDDGGIEFVTRPTRLGNDAIVYVLTEAGRAHTLPDA